MNKVAYALVGLFLLLGCRQPSGGSPAGNSGQKNGVELQILDFEGIQKLIASHRGKVVVMDAWSTSCTPCIKEFPKLVALHHEFGPQKLACISLSFDFEGIGTPQEQVPRVQGFLQSKGASFDNVLSSEESASLYRKFHLASIPAVFVYDQSGNLSKRFDNQQAQSEAESFTYEQVRELVAKLLAEGTLNQ